MVRSWLNNYRLSFYFELKNYIAKYLLLVSQEVQLNEISREQTPIQCVLAADVQRRLLLEESAELDRKESLSHEEQM